MKTGTEGFYFYLNNSQMTTSNQMWNTWVSFELIDLKAWVGGWVKIYMNHLLCESDLKK